MGKQGSPVHVDMIERRHELGERRDAHGRFGHAAAHDGEAKLTGSGDHPSGWGEAAAFDQLYVDAMEVVNAPLHVAFRDAALIRHDRQDRVAADLCHAGIVAGQGLLDEFHAQISQWAGKVDRLAGRPAAVGIDPKGAVGVSPQFADDLQVLSGAEFDLEDRPLGHLGQLRHHHLHPIDADRKVGERSGGRIEAPERVQRPALQPGPEVVEGQVEAAQGERSGS